MESSNPFDNIPSGREADPLFNRWVEICREHRKEGVELADKIGGSLRRDWRDPRKARDLLAEQTRQNDATAREIIAAPQTPWARDIMTRVVENRARWRQI